MSYTLNVLHEKHAEEPIIKLHIPAMAGREAAKKLFALLDAQGCYNTASGSGRKIAYYDKDLPDERTVREVLRTEAYEGKEDIVQFVKKAKNLAASHKVNPIYIFFN